jgi:hypothetical protein
MKTFIVYYSYDLDHGKIVSANAADKFSCGNVCGWTYAGLAPSPSYTGIEDFASEADAKKFLKLFLRMGEADARKHFFNA